MKLLNTLAMAMLFFSLQSNGQNFIPNSGFENWSTVTYEDLDNYLTENGVAIFEAGTPTAFKSTDAQNGNYSIRLETKVGTYDTLFGFFTSGLFERSNGYPYSQQPDSLVGYYKCNIAVGDTGYVISRFSNLGSVFSFNAKTFTSTQNTNTWTRFAIPLNVPMVPDSMFIGAVCSNALNNVGVNPSSWLMLDNLTLVGNNITQGVLNGDFENWTNVSVENPTDWSSPNLYANRGGVLPVTKTTDQHTGNFALKLETALVRDDTLGFITNGTLTSGNIIGGQPFSIVFDTLVGHYKYSPVGLDTAGLAMTFSKNGNQIGLFFKAFTASSTYTPFEVPFVLPQVPDTLRIDIVSSLVENRIGSTLFIDDLILKSIVTSLHQENDIVDDFHLYPNPFHDHFIIKMNVLQHSNLSIIDAIGREYWNGGRINKGAIDQMIDCSDLPAGAYFLRVQTEHSMTHYKILKD